MDNKKILRLFISSTFDDFSIERDALQNQVFPYISEICYQNGYQFFPIDLRWGVSSEAQVDQKTLDICLKEVDKCISEPHPDFLMLIGNRYGWIPLQNKIEQKEFENIVELLSSDDKYLVANWYELDENEIPSSYILRKRKDEYQNDSNWFKIEGYLRNIFQKVVIKSNLDENTKDKYFTSAIEYELLQYLKNKTNKESIFVFNREIKNSINQTSKYFEKSNKLESLKNKLGNLVLEENYLKIDTNINENDQISDQYIEEFITKIKNILEQAVLRNIIRNDTLNEFSQEIFVQQNFLENSSKDIVGRTQEIGYILGYLNNKEIAPPLFLYGESGIGKTSIIAKAIKEYQNISTNKIVYRFCGISKASSNSYDLLVSILDELKIDINEFKINSEESLELKSLDNKKNKTEEFELNILDKLNSIKEETTIFIDSLDQLEDQTQLYWLSSVLPKNLKIVISVLNDKKYSDDSIYFEKIQYKFDNLFEIKNIQDVNISKEIILNYLEQENRKLNSDQLEYINNIYQKVQFPFYLKIISQEVKNWKSDFSDFELPNDKEEAVNKFIDNLVEKRHHNRLLVEKFFSYIFASQFNLNESTLYHILSNDEELIKSINNIYHQNIIYIPLSIWSRFFYDISPFIKENESGNISFFHREFNNSIEKYYNHEASSKLLNIIEKLINESNNEVYLFKLLEIYIHTLCYETENFDIESKERIDFLLSNSTNIELCENIINFMFELENKCRQVNYSKKAISYAQNLYFFIKELYSNDKDRWLGDYSRSLNNLALSYSKTNRTTDAIKLQEEAKKITEEVYFKDKDRWLGDYSRSLNNLATLYSNTNRTTDAIKLQEEAKKIREEAYFKDKDRWLGDYSLILNNLAGSYSKTNRIDEAIKLQEEALDILKEAYFKDKDRWIEDYSRCLNNLAGLYYKNNRTTDAIKLQEEAKKITEEAYFKDKDRWIEDYSRCLINLAHSYSKTNRTTDAIKLQEEAKKITEEAYLKDKNRWFEYYSRSLNNLAALYFDTDRIKEAIKLYEEAVYIVREAYLKDKNRWLEDYSLSLNLLALSYFDTNRIKEAIKLQENAKNITEEAYQNDKHRWLGCYSLSLYNLADFYSNLGKKDKAITLQEQLQKIQNNN